ncbi:hypothetical protein [Rhodopseudomonas sp. B29]|uniref:hypothetical protein n=1 Tax=Rhodopseudomonas sp. B29 TaxID=95607 RepID=UPI0003B6C50C|nr:hypothetical protein [Rhodopseudomonas sp. B29]
MSDEERKDPPVEELDYVGGVKVVDFGDIRIARGKSRRPFRLCRHLRLTYDQSERRIWCQDCETNVEAFDAFLILVEWHDRAVKAIDRRLESVKDAEAHSLRSLAARAVDKAWSSLSSLPTCPTCQSGLFPEDFKDGRFGSVGREYAEALRSKRKGDK